jgi:uncharacterized phosphosugar-binding protein
MTDLIQAYFSTCVQQLQQVQAESHETIEQAAAALAAALTRDQGFYLFGSGHSALIAREAFWRAGGLAPAMPISDPMQGDAERLPGFGAALLGHYDLQDGDVLVVISNSGVNPLPIEIAMQGKARGVTVIALTCLAHSRAVDSRHASGRKLMDIADIVIDTHGALGDAALPLPNRKWKVGATSTVIGAAIIEALTSRAAEIMVERGLDPPVIASSNAPGGDRHNREVAERYRERLIRYEVPTAQVSGRSEGG